MFSRKVERAPKSRSCYRRLVRYLLDPKDTLERVGRVTLTNFHSDDPMVAALEALAVQRLNRRAKGDKTYHLFFSFPNGERPGQEVLLDCERELCRALGFEEHQRVSVVHHDTDNLHVHVAINTIHPIRHTIHTPFNDYWVHRQIPDRLEIKHNLTRENHGMRDPASGPSGPAGDMERHAGLESFLGWVQRHAAEDLCRASSWESLHQAAHAHGLNLQLRGNGCVITQGEHAVRASSVRRELSLNALQKRLGAFEPARTQAAASADNSVGASQQRSSEASATPPPPPHLRGKQASLSGLVGQSSGGHVVAPVQQSGARVSIEELQQRSEDWSRLIADVVRAHQAKETLQLQADRKSSSRRARPLPDRPPPPHIRNNLERLRASRDGGRNAESSGTAMRPSPEELQQRSEDWSRLIAELSRSARGKAGQRVQAVRDAIAERRRVTGVRTHGQGALADRPPSPHIRNNPDRLRAAHDAGATAEPTGATMRPSPEELQQRSEDWSRLIAELSRSARLKTGHRLRGTRAAVAKRRRTYVKRPLGASDGAGKLYALYLKDRVQREVLRREQGAELRRVQRADFQRVVERWRLRRAALRLVSGTRAEKRFMYAAARLAMQQDLKALRARAASDRRALARATKRLAWIEWLRARARSGDGAALEELRRRRSSASARPDAQRGLAGAASSVRDRAPQGNVDAVTKLGSVIYRGALTGVRDDGDRLRVQGPVSQVVLAEALRVAANRYGSALRVEGDAAFKRAVVDVAIASKLEVTFDDESLEAQRRAQQSEETDSGRRVQPGSDRGRSERQQSGPTSSENAAQRQAPGPKDGLRDLPVGELVHDGQGPQRVLPAHVLTHVAGETRRGDHALRRRAGATRKVNDGPPPFRRGRLRPLSGLTTTPRPNPQSQSTPRVPIVSGQGRGVDAPRPIAPRKVIASLGSTLPAHATTKPKLPLRGRITAAEAVDKYIAERDAKRALGIADVRPHAAFDGRAGEFTFVGRRTVDGHKLLLVRSSTKIVVLPAPPQSETLLLRSGDRVALDAEGALITRSQGRRR